jgi:hypothetical protein
MPKELLFRNDSGYEFVDVSNMQVLEYHFTNRILRIDEPWYLYISESGGHRVFSKRGRCLYIPTGWLWSEWKAHDDKPHFTF